jgi:hypothetical protein
MELAACGGQVVTTDEVPGAWITPSVVDHLAPAATRNRLGRVDAEHGRSDGLVHLVSGWRDGGSSADTDPVGWTFLDDLRVRTLQHKPLRDALEGRRAVTVSHRTARNPEAGRDDKDRHGDLDAPAR